MCNKLLVNWPFIDLILAAVWIFLVWLPWRHDSASKVIEDKTDERLLGATVILAQLNGIITGTSIIIVGIGAFAVLVKEHSGPQSYHTLYAAIWAVVALGTALYTMSTLPTRAPTQNFVRAKWVAILTAMALFFSLAAGVRFLFAVSSILFASDSALPAGSG
jgi:hypothetical protein